MTNDKIMFKGSKVVLLDSNGTDYKAKVFSERLFYFIKVAVTCALFALMMYIAHNGYSSNPAPDVDSTSHFVSVLGTVIGTMMAFFATFGMACQLKEAYIKWENAVNNYNCAVSDNQEKLLAAHETLAQHQAKLTSITTDNKVVLQEKSISVN